MLVILNEIALLTDGMEGGEEFKSLFSFRKKMNI